MGYVQRTTPSQACVRAFKAFNESMQHAFEEITGRDLSEGQGNQILAPMRHAGLGLCSTVDTADEAYLASLLATREIRSEL